MRQMPIMTSHMRPFPWAVDIGLSIRAALDEMVSHNIHHLPVKSGSEVVGIVSAEQLTLGLTKDDAESDLTHYCDHSALKFQTRDTLDLVLSQMIEFDQGAVLVMKDDRLAGIYTARNAIHHLFKLMTELYPTDNDAA